MDSLWCDTRTSFIAELFSRAVLCALFQQNLQKRIIALSLPNVSPVVESRCSVTNPPLQRRSDRPASARRARAWLRTTTSGRPPPRATTAPPIPPAGASPPWMPRGPSFALFHSLPWSLSLLVPQGLWAKPITFRCVFSLDITRFLHFFCIFQSFIRFYFIGFLSASFERYHLVSIIPSGSTLCLNIPPPQRWPITQRVCKGIP